MVYICNRWSELTFTELGEVRGRSKTDECMQLIPPEGKETDTIKGDLRLNRSFTVHPG